MPMEKGDGMFKVINKRTGKEPDLWQIARRCKWAKHLVYCDMEGFAIEEDGTLILLDECGNVAYPPNGMFEIIWDSPAAHGHWEETPIPIWLRNNTTRTYYFKCNKCSSTSWNRDNYCSHCGAKMDEVTE